MPLPNFFVIGAAKTGGDFNPAGEKSIVAVNLQEERLDYLDGLRALACLWVVLFHASCQAAAVLGTKPLSDVVWTGLRRYFYYSFYYGHYAVDVFIVLSGFCLMLPVVHGDGTLRQGAFHFFRRRARRILPPYYAAMAFSLLLMWLFLGPELARPNSFLQPVTGQSIITYLLLVQDAFGDDRRINPVFWSIAVEWRIYFLFPLLVWGWRRLGPLNTTLLALVTSYLLFRLCRHLIGNPLSAHYIGLFALGMLGATIALAPAVSLSSIAPSLSKLPWSRLTVAMTPVVLMLPRVKLWNGALMPMHLQDYVVGLWSMSVLIVAAHPGKHRPGKHWLCRILSYKPLVFIGTISYSIYLIHFPLLWMLRQYVLFPFCADLLSVFTALYLVAVPGIIALSYLFFLICERPFLHRRVVPGKEPVAVEEPVAIKVEPVASTGV